MSNQHRIRFHYGLLLMFAALWTSHSLIADTPPAVRDPFWPVGYVPPSPEEAAQATPAVPELAWPELQLRGRSRSRDGSYFALIDGVGVVRTGEIVSLAAQGYWFHWRVVRIDATGVQTKPLGITADPAPPPVPVPADERKDDERWNQ